MEIRGFLKGLDFSASAEKLAGVEKEVLEFLSAFKKVMRTKKVRADIFVGGSFAKGTLTKSNEYDIDIFVRFMGKSDRELSEKLASVLGQREMMRKWAAERVHGSRDYFRILIEKDTTLEIIPVKKINTPGGMENVTDLSFFHVKYVKNKLKKNKNLIREIGIAKTFCKAAGIYGAESYIQGFSGYGLECLIIHYGSFEKMLKALLRAKKQIVIDPEKYYKKKEMITVEVNEAKLKNKIVLIDPTWKSRNVLAALSDESFSKFREAAAGFLKKPSMRFFEVKKDIKEKMIEEAKRMKAEFASVILETDKQEGDIAGTKMKKFSGMLEAEIKVYFDILKKEFTYRGGKDAELLLIIKSRKEILKRGPPVKMERHAISFRKEHKNIFVKKGNLWARTKINFSLKDFVLEYNRKNKEKIEDMGITGLDVS